MKRIPAAVRKKAASIRLLLLDVDGVLTDGRIIIDERGMETKQFHVRDGQGIALLLRSGIDVGFITARSSRSVRHRAKELGVRLVHQGVRNKLDVYNEDWRASMVFAAQPGEGRVLRQREMQSTFGGKASWRAPQPKTFRSAAKPASKAEFERSILLRPACGQSMRSPI